MEILEEHCRLRAYVGEDERWHGVPLYEAILLRARELGLAGASVFRGSMGYGRDSQLHTAKVLRLSHDLPLVVEIVERRDRIETLLPHLEEMLAGGLVTLEPVQVLDLGGAVDR